MIPRSLRCASLLLAATLPASALDLSGTVKSLDGAPKSGVKVVLASSGDSVLTNATGAWAFGSISASRRIPSSVIGGHLMVREGRLSLAYRGMDVAGRCLPGQGISSANARVPFAARVSSVPDTLVYSFQGRVFLRDTVSVGRSAIVRVYDTTWNASIVYGYLTDARDGQTYRTAMIGPQVWMAQNLNVKVAGKDSGWAYNNSPDSARKYGRLYSWASAMGLDDSCNTKACSTMVKSPQQGLCPVGWHVPSEAEWTRLTDTTLNTSTAGRVLRSRMGWIYNDNGTDSVGFRALPAGGRDSGDYFNRAGGTFSSIGSWWSSEEHVAGYAWNHIIDHAAFVHLFSYVKAYGLSLRCRKD